MKKLPVLLAAAAAVLSVSRAADEEGFKSLFDGKSLDAWKVAEKEPNSFKLVDGAIVANGPACHLFYVGDAKPFKNFVLKLQVMTKPKSNGGVYVHTKYQDTGWPNTGHECQVNQTHSDPIKTGSIYRCANVMNISPAKDDAWFDYEIQVVGKKCTVSVNGKVVNEWTEPAEGAPGVDPSWRFGEGTFALQAHDPVSVVMYKNIRVKRLPD
jgi:3-keto-disaccharide hydrolase